MALATLSIDLVAQLAQLQDGLDKAGRMAEKNAAQIEGRYKRLQSAAFNVGSALGAALSAAGMVQFFKATVDGLDRLNDLRDATGASVENLSALEDIAARTGTSMDTVSDAVVKLNKALGDAKPGSEAAAVFKALNLNVEDLKRLDPAEAFRRVAVALSGFADDGNKARNVQELFGKSLKEVAPLLKDVVEAGQLNATVTTEQAKAAEKFNEQLFALQKNSIDAARAISGPLINSLNGFFEKARAASDSTKTLGERLNSLFGAAKSLGFGALFGLNNEDVSRLAQAKTELAAIETSLKRQFNSEQRRAQLEGMRIDRLRTIARLQTEGADAYRPSQNYGDAFKPSLPSVIGGGGGKGVRKAPPLLARQLDPVGLSAAAVDALKAIESTDTAKIRALNAVLDELFVIRASGAGTGADVDQAITKLRDDLEKLSPAAQAAAAAQKELIALLADTPTAQMESLQRTASLLADEMGRAADPTQINKAAEALGQVYEKMRGIRDAVKPVTVEMSEFARQAAANIQDALGDTLVATLDGKFSSIGKLWGDMLKKLIAQAAAAKLSKYLLGDDFAKSGNVGGAIGTFFTYLQGLGARADGGPVSAGRPYLVGERGPEIMVPRNSGTVLPNGVGLAAGGGSTFHVNVQGDASENTLRLINASLAQFEARLLARRGA